MLSSKTIGSVIMEVGFTLSFIVVVIVLALLVVEEAVSGKFQVLL